MILSRRALLVSAGAAASAAALPTSPVAAALPAPLAAATETQPLPPPLPAAVFRERADKLRAAARQRALDAILVTPSTNLAYAVNLAIGGSERLTALILFADGPAVLVTPSFEEGNHRKTAVVDDVRVWKEDEDPIALVAKILEGKKAIGVEGATPYGTVAKLSAAYGGKLEEANSLFDPLRRVKSADEQAFIRAAADRTSAAIDATQRRVRKGMTEHAVADLLEAEYRRLGVSGGGLVQFGPSSAFPHGAPEERRLEKGDTVLIDSGCKVHGYTSDVTRTAVFGEPSDELRKVYGVVERAQSAGIAALKTGAIP